MSSHSDLVPDMTYNVFGGTLSLTQSVSPGRKRRLCAHAFIDLNMRQSSASCSSRCRILGSCFAWC